MRKFIVMLMLSMLGSVAFAQDGNEAVVPGFGEIQDVRLETESLVIHGLLYKVAPDAEVEIAGSYGAFTMLKEGMQVRFLYRPGGANAPVITLLKELPAGQQVPQT